jgi:hypothetical protein
VEILLVSPPMRVDRSIIVGVNGRMGWRCLEHLAAVSAGGEFMDVLGGAASPPVASDVYGRFKRW